MVFTILKNLAGNKSLLRILMNLSFKDVPLSGLVVDIGGGRNPDYFNYFDMKAVRAQEIVDGSVSGIDFEKDPLPYGVGTVDTVLLCNVLEHVFNHSFLLSEIERILKRGGKCIGFVPFFINYHPDPHDYFRYTDEALKKLFSKAGFSDVMVQRVGGGPFYVNFNTIVLSVPRFLRPILFLPYFLLDRLFLMLRPGAARRYPLGYTFYATKAS